jgi:hypothetical protein
MSFDKRLGKKVPEFVRREDTPGLRLDSGPYIGKIKNNLDSTRTGRLQVWIPDLGAGDETDPSNWRTVSYASPFFGGTNSPSSSVNSFSNVEHTYGMWFTVPDLNNLVLCTFVAGDPMRGYWFACVPNQLGHHMVPGIAGSSKIDAAIIEDPEVKKKYRKNVLPVAEFNESGIVDWSSFTTLLKPIHEAQAAIMQTQGLDRDVVRGPISSSSQRESPSTVFGISTPGRPTNDKANDAAYKALLKSGKATAADYLITARKGGHQFVMDDGDFFDTDRLIRLRTAGGHQLLMNDTERVIYIGNSTGSAWVELTGSGHVNIFSASSINIRTQADLNLHADKDININAKGSFNVSSGAAMNLQSGAFNMSTSGKAVLYASNLSIGSSGQIDLNAGSGGSFSASQTISISGSTLNLNSGSGATVSKPKPLAVYKLSDTGLDKSGLWQSTAGALSSIVKIAPSHEPWPRKSGNPNAAASSAAVASGTVGGDNLMTGAAPTANIAAVECNSATVSSGSGGVVTDSSGNPILSGAAASLDSGPKAAAAASVKNPVNRSYLIRADNPTPDEGIGPLTAVQTKALMTQIAWNESGYDYTKVEAARGNYLGKYQIGAAVLTDQGFIKRDAFALYGTSAVNYPASWKNGITSKEDFLANPAVQEQVMTALLRSNYSALTRTSGLKNGDDICTVAGMLAASHLLGAGGANTWRKTAGGSDANGTTGSTYFNMGRYAVDVLAAKS